MAAVAEVQPAPQPPLGAKAVKVQLTEEQAWKLLLVLEQAIDTRLPRVIEVVQDCLQVRDASVTGAARVAAITRARQRALHSVSQCDLQE